MAADRPAGTSTPDTPAAKSSAKPRRLGRGLASLVSNTREDKPAEVSARSGEDATYQPVSRGEPPLPEAGPREIEIDRISSNPYQPRTHFQEDELAELADSIREAGLLQPLLVTPRKDDPGRYFVVAGERRLRAAELAERKTVPCMVRNASQEQMLQWALIENIRRSELNAVERSVAYREFMDRFGLTQQQLAERLGEPRSTVANYLRVLDLVKPAQEALQNGKISFGHAKVLASLASDPARQEKMLQAVLKQDLSVRALEERLNGQGQNEDQPKATSLRAGGAVKSQHILDLERQLSQQLGNRVTIRPGRGKNKHRGRIVIEYHSLEDFDRLMATLDVSLS